MLSVIYYILEIRNEFWGLYKPLLAAEVFLILFMLASNNAIYIVLTAKTNMDKYKHFQKIILILIAPIITIAIFLIWFFARNIIF